VPDFERCRAHINLLPGIATINAIANINPLAASTPPAPHLQKALTELRNKQLAAQVHLALPTARDKAFFRSGAQSPAGAFMYASAAFPPNRMTDEEVRDTYKLRLGAALVRLPPLPPGQKHKCATCGSNMDAKGLHAFSCPKMGARTTRHHRVCTALAQEYASATRGTHTIRQEVDLEQAGVTRTNKDPGHAVIADFVIQGVHSPISNAGLADVTVVNPAWGSNPESAGEPPEQGTAAAEAHRDKMAHYIARIRHNTELVLPVPFETGGFVHMASSTWCVASLGWPRPTPHPQP